MSENNKDSDTFKIWYALSFAFQLGFLIAVPITGFMLLGLWGDRNFQTSPLLLIVSMIAGVAITFYEIYRLLLPLLTNDHVFLSAKESKRSNISSDKLNHGQ